jgi:hypothetical protein
MMPPADDARMSVLKATIVVFPVFLLLSFTAEDEVEDEGVTALVVCPFNKPLLSEDDATRILAFDDHEFLRVVVVMHIGYIALSTFYAVPFSVGSRWRGDDHPHLPVVTTFFKLTSLSK